MWCVILAGCMHSSTKKNFRITRYIGSPASGSGAFGFFGSGIEVGLIGMGSES